MHFPIIHPFTTPFFIYSFFPLSVLSFEIFIYNSTLNINHYIRRHIMPEGAVILTLTKSDVFEKKKKKKSAIAAIVVGRIDPKIIDISDPAIKAEINGGIGGMEIKESTKMELLERLELSEEWDGPISEETLAEVCKAVGSSLVTMGQNPKTLVEGSPGSSTVMRDENGSCSINDTVVEPILPKEKLRTVFWNSNGWNADKGQKIAELVATEGANIVGITDTRIKASDMGKKLSTLIFFLEIKTKLKWRGKAFPMIPGAEAGGSILAVSDRFMDAKFSEILPGGILSGVKGNWGKFKMNIGLLYRPSMGTGAGSLRQKAKSLIGKELDQGIGGGGIT